MRGICSLGEARGQLALDLAGWKATADRLERHVTDESFLGEVGKSLFEALFRGANAELGELLSKAIGATQGGLRVRLRLEPPEIAALPWELLYDPSSKQFLAASLGWRLVRYVELPQRRPSLETPFPVRVLAVLPEVRDLDTKGELGRLEQALRDIQDRVTLETLDGRVTYARLRDELQERSPHVVHFIGHGDFQDGVASLRLNGEDGSDVWIDARTFGELFRFQPSIRLCVLNACKGGRVSSTQPLVGMAPELVRTGLPAVIAMQYAIYDDVAVHFAQSFYHGLFRAWTRGQVELAMARARNDVRIEYPSERSFAAPVLYSRAPHGWLFHLPDVGQLREVVRDPRAEAQARALADAHRIDAQEHERTSDGGGGTEQAAAERTEADRLVRRVQTARRIRVSAVAAAVASFLLFGVGIFDAIRLESNLEGIAIWLGSALGRHELSEHIAIVAIAPSTLELLDPGKRLDARWRGRLAALLDRLVEAQAAVVAFDVTFKPTADAPPEATAALARAIREARRAGTGVVVAVKEMSEEEPVLDPQIRAALVEPIPGGAHGAWGSAALGTEFRIAHGMLIERPRGSRHYVRSLGLEAAAAFWGEKLLGVDVEDRKIVLGSGASTLHSIDYAWEEDPPFWQDTKMIRAADHVFYQFADPSPASALRAPTRTLLYEDVVKAAPTELRGKLVLVGETETEDSARVWRGWTEVHWGVELHAQAISTLLRQVVIRPVHPAAQFVWMLGLAALAAGVRLLVPSPTRRRILLAALALTCVVATIAASAFYLLLNLPYLLLSLLLGHASAAWLERRAGRSSARRRSA